MFRVLLLLAVTAPAFAAPVPLNQRVLVVYNARSKDSRHVANYYVKNRSIPAANTCALNTIRLQDHTSHWEPSIASKEFQRKVVQPIRRCLTRVGKKKVLYIVLTFGTPYHLTDTRTGAGVSIDSYLADVWNLKASSPEGNPYYAPVSPKAEVYPAFESFEDYRARPDARLIYSVWRLDAATAQLAMGLVDKATEAEQNGLKGIACFDRRRGGDDMKDVEDAGYGTGEWELFRAAQFAREAGFEVLEDSHPEEFGTPPAPLRCDGAALYSGWYQLRHYNDAFSWNVGAIGFHLDSESVASPRAGENWSANALKKGITVTSGSVDEPFLTGLPHPAGVFRNLFEGANVGDAFFRNTAQLRWQNLNVGDPLYRPFPGGLKPFNEKKDN